MVPTRAHRHRWGLSRREMLRAGGSDSSAWAWTTSARPGPRRRGGRRPRSVILAFCPGAPSHIDTWDPKPDAPEQIRGEFATIATRTPGLRVCEHLPRLAALSDRYSLIRSMTHGEREHEPGSHAMLAGLPQGAGERQRAGQPVHRLAQPRVRLRLRPPRARPTCRRPSSSPRKLTFGGYSFPGQNAGFLGARYDPWHLEGDPNAPASSPRRSTSPRA